MTTQTTTSAAALTDTDAARLLDLALHTPAGLTAPAAAAALGHSEAWVYAQLDTGIEDGTVTRLGPDLRAGAGLYQATRVTVTAAALLAGGLVALADRGWTPDDVIDDAGRVDLSGSLHLAAGVHPLELPDDERLLLALYDAEDALAAALGADPTVHDAGDLLTLWQTTAGVTPDHVAELLLTAVRSLAGEVR
ncbi:hypothetical protein Ga0074812_14840 [Parafrankia irregularis]|uniref:Uncharacterized protein n=1 Tax=Parafrankia irregularis TaxID=795642 RepID=A0A0S4R1B3_9ACTN|nr:MULTISPECIES: hypothetical protein [Parafrankia]MBE3206765.1 hypothetical protein [Parafrankia sp. CH37]CUU60840.1 hypothetical protein Ga0074812_14840 [Parafrankia irregularis]